MLKRVKIPQVVLVVKSPSANAKDVRDGVRSLGRKIPGGVEVATHSIILA